MAADDQSPRAKPIDEVAFPHRDKGKKVSRRSCAPAGAGRGGWRRALEGWSGDGSPVTVRLGIQIEKLLGGRRRPLSATRSHLPRLGPAR